MGSLGISELVNPLMSMIVLPYLGPAASREELDREVVVERRRTPRHVRRPLRRPDMRLTYRTMRVLLAIGAEPGASNRRVAEIAGVEDQGQISKLLARLRGLGLIENATDGREKGTPNAWRLTARGEQILHTVEQG
jgi:DNA-binding MarR family transcriptional regulator